MTSGDTDFRAGCWLALPDSVVASWGRVDRDSASNSQCVEKRNGKNAVQMFGLFMRIRHESCGSRQDDTVLPVDPELLSVCKAGLSAVT